MSDNEAKYNLLKSSCFMPSIANTKNASSTMYALGADGWVCGAGSDSRSWAVGSAEWYVDLPAGTYALLYEVDGKQGAVWDGLRVYVDGSVEDGDGHHDGPYAHALAFKLGAPSAVHIMAKCYAPARYRLMLVEGTEPAAWAPAEGESLAGGGAQMSANLLEGVTPTLANGTTESDGVWHHAARTGTDSHDDWLVWDLAGQSALATNQTYHVGLSARGASANSASLHATIGYKDAAGNVNWATSDPLPIGTSWGRAEATIVVPSGMTPFAFYVAAYGECPETWMTSPVLSYGSPVPLASSAHTPYATQDHVMVTYATKASLKVTDDSVKAEVSARAQTDRNVADLSSRLTQTANSLTSEISDRRTAITTVTGLANAAQSTADAAKSSASNAVSTANSASSSAANAVETANAASSAASAASTAAGKASTDAAAAVKTANSASSTASGAVTTANEAAATANAASDTATAAQTMATENRSSIKQLSNSITSEVNARVKTDGAVSELSSKLSQTVNGINVSLDKLAATEKQIHSWFDFGTDSSGNPKLAMGSSSSPIIGEYSNTGTTYKDRAGATLLALDAANSTTGADHVVAKDMTVGKWKWVPTNGGDNLTLVWIGG